MAAPKGNEFWRIRSRHGREKLFTSPELLWEAATEYFKWVDENPLTKSDWVGKDGDEVTRKLGRPYTLHGLCLYLGCDPSYFRTFKSTIHEKDKDFLAVIHAIENVVYTQQYDGASVGIFNHNIIARALGLVDKQESKVESNVQITGMKII